LVIGKDGVPRNIRVLTPLGFGLDEQAIAAVGLWRFKPALKEGLPVAVSANISVSFKIIAKRTQE
jgi:TonB family protein